MTSQKIKLVLIMFVIIACSETTRSQQNSKRPAVFLPGVVSTEDHEFNSCFSNDKKSFYFARTNGKKSQLYVTSQQNGKWHASAKLSFCDTAYAYADPAFSPQGDLYFISDMPLNPSDTTRDYDLWKTSLHNGRWQDPVNIEALNSEKDEFYISFTSQGDAYFSSSRAGGFGEEDIYFAKFSKGSYDTPENMGAHINTVHSEYDPFISNDGKMLFFASSGRGDSIGKADLYWIQKGEKWEGVNHFGPDINTPTRDYCPYLDSNGNFFFSSEGEVKITEPPASQR